MRSFVVGSFEVVRSQLRRRQRSLAAWMLGLAVVSVTYIGFWPAFEADTLEQLTAGLPEGLTEALGYDRIGTPEGWLTSTVYGLLAPVLLLVFVIGLGARSVADDERSGLLSVELSQPVTRTQVVIGRFVSGLVGLLVVLVALTVAALVTAQAVGMGVGVDRVVGAGVALFGFVVPWLAAAWSIAAVTGRRSIAVGVTAAAATSAYMVHVLGTGLARDSIAGWSPFHWYIESDPVSAGPGLWGGLVSVAAVIAAVGVGSVGFARRDIGG